MLLAICKENPLSNPVEIGSYRGFQMEVYYDTVNANYCLNLCGMWKYKVDLGMDALGNLTLQIHFFLETLVACGKHFDLRKGESHFVHVLGRTDRAFARHYLADKFLLSLH